MGHNLCMWIYNMYLTSQSDDADITSLGVRLLYVDDSLAKISSKINIYGKGSSLGRHTV